MLERLLCYLSKEWDTLRSAPIAFVLIGLIAVLGSWATARWHYARKIRSLKERVGGTDERLAAKDRILAEYRARLYQVSSEQESYSRLSNGELRERVLAWVGEFRDFLKSPEGDYAASFFAEFKANAIVLRDELLSRLPRHARDNRWFSSYEHARDPAQMSVVADDLERLAGSLR